MIGDEIDVILAMPHYWVIGKMPTQGMRLQDLLARTNSDFVSLAQAQVFTNEAEKSPLADLTDVLIPKRQILCISTSGDQHEAPANRLYNFQPRDQYKVVLILDNYLVEGLAHIPMTSTSVAYSIYRGCGSFSPLTQAIVRAGSTRRIKFPFLLVNTEHLRTVGLSNTDQSGAPVPPCSAVSSNPSRAQPHDYSAPIVSHDVAAAVDTVSV